MVGRRVSACSFTKILPFASMAFALAFGSSPRSDGRDYAVLSQNFVIRKSNPFPRQCTNSRHRETASAPRLPNAVFLRRRLSMTIYGTSSSDLSRLGRHMFQLSSKANILTLATFSFYRFVSQKLTCAKGSSSSFMYPIIRPRV
ncbi:hypothetical protein BU26DRAFT_506728 [Trematosphaeria pertusa]|uniref:Secreted protein n=1 Tax=Trematosphaeria pertusa TaxID=390896 RepID=A0A6A6ID65_9PLEO|nr:uncharacterized protein BU26DRAFT_506728 [Trematosphaeria pertusa]KAF2247500.1 hypothetical protein BU26DRAFT_506728 [Trematosphaeria pertusa]